MMMMSSVENQPRILLMDEKNITNKNANPHGFCAGKSRAHR